MSADNWDLCPKCQTHLDRYENEGEEKLREDYEFYLNGNILEIDYSCNCKNCEFSFEFHKKMSVFENLDTEPKKV